MENNKIKDLINYLSNMVIKCDEEEILSIIKVFSDLIKNENKNIRMEFIDNISQIYLSYSDEPMPEDNKEYKLSIIEQEKLLKQYVPEEKRLNFDNTYCLPLAFEYENAYKKGVIDGLTKLSFLKELL